MGIKLFIDVYKMSNNTDLLTFYIFVEFMRRRFPNESNVSYISEWVERFQRKQPIFYMDDISTDIYNQIKKEIGIV